MSDPVITPDDVTGVAGEIDPRVVKQIIATGATLDEITRAVAEIEDEHSFDDHRSISRSPRVDAVRALLRPVLAFCDDPVSRGRD